MRAVVIGGTGHIGTYLVPRLVDAGYEVTSVSRLEHSPYQNHACWKSVRQVQIDRTSADAKGIFGTQIAEMAPDVVIDLICYSTASVKQLVEALRGKLHHFLHCGTIWVHGHSVQVPTTEDQPRAPFGEYGINKAAIEDYLLQEGRRGDFPATILHPGHIVGPGWFPLNPAGNFNSEVFARLARGEELMLPNLGMETVHHVHADDVVQAFVLAMTNWSGSIGEGFHVVSPAALTLRGYAESMAAWFGKPSRLSFAPWEEWRKSVSEEDSQATWDHISHSPNCSIAKAQRIINYQPRYTSLEAVKESVNWLIENRNLLA